MASIITAGIALAGLATIARIGIKAYNRSQGPKSFYLGGFEGKMSKREAALILGVRESSNIEKIKQAHRKIMLLNHPDRGGSPYLAMKINEAKEFLEKTR